MKSILILVLLFGCAEDSSRTADTAVAAAPEESDSDDYSAWFEGISQSEIDDFERQDDADQLAHPTEIPEPDHDAEPASTVRARRSSATRVDTNDAIAANTTVDAGTGSGSDGGGVVDAGVDAGSGGVVDAGTGGVDAGSACASSSVTVTGMASLDVQFGVAVPAQYLGTFGPVRQHNIWASGSAAGTVRLTLSGSLTATANSWTATINVSGAAGVTVWIHAFQELVGVVRRWFAIGDATLSGTATFGDSVTFTKTCSSGVVVTTPGTPAIGVNVTVDDFTFYGLFFPRLQGPLVTRVRGAIAQFARNFANRQLAAWLQPRVFAANQAYANKKAELLGQLVAALPQGCGCP